MILYRYGFNGKENDNEVKGEGNQQDYGMRIYDPRIGKFLSVDPITAQYPELTPYQFASNTPIMAIDLDGLEAHIPAKAYENASLTDIAGAGDIIFKYLKGFGGATLDWMEKTSPWNVSEDRFYERAEEFDGLVKMVQNPKQAVKNIKKGVVNWTERLSSTDPEVAGAALAQGLTFAADIYLANKLVNTSMAFYEGNSIIKKAMNDGVKVIVATSDDDLAYLRYMQAQALYMEGEGKAGSILVEGAKVSRPAILEEAIHHQQRLKHGAEYMQNAVNKARLEIEAQNTLLRIGKKEGWSAGEMGEIKGAKVKWEQHLKQLEKGSN